MGAVSSYRWEELAETLISRKGTAMLLGETDTGKSTLARYLVGKLVFAGIPVSLVDADIGQSSLGLPGSVSYADFGTPEEAAEFRCRRFTFLGSVNPVPVMAALINETRRFARLGENSSVVTLVDTTGLVAGDYGIRLKAEKIKAVGPGLLIAVEREGELEHILETADDSEVFRLQPSPFVNPRSAAQRSRYREEKFAEYFRNAGELPLDTRSHQLFFLGAPIRHGDVRIKTGIVVGLNRGGQTAGLGIVTETDSHILLIRTPLASLKGIGRVLFGNISFEESSMEDFPGLYDS